MSVINGNSGSIKWDANTVSQMTDWTLDINTDYLESTEFGDSWKEFQSGLLSFTGSASGKFDKTDTNGHIAVKNAALGGTSASVTFDMDGSSTFTGTCFVTASLKASVSGLVEISYKFQGTGQLSYNAG
jgi:hypothetical protein